MKSVVSAFRRTVAPVVSGFRRTMFGRTVIIAAALAAAVRAQEPVAPTFRSATTLVEFTLVAQDAHGNPVTDLTQDEIVVTEHGRPRDLAFFRFEGGTAPGKSLTLPPHVFTNRLEYLPNPPRNLTAIVIDSLNTNVMDQPAVRNYVLGYLRNASPDTQVAIYRLGEQVQIVHDFTSDFRALQARLERSGIEGQLQPEIVPDEQVAAVSKAAAIDLLSMDSRAMLSLAAGEMARLEDQYGEHVQGRKTDMTWSAFEMIGNHLAAVPGRKSLVWITGGVPIVRVGTQANWFTNYEKAIREAAQRLAGQGIAIYPVDATGLRGAKVGSNAASPEQSRKLATMGVVADVTGGRVLTNTNDLASGMKAAADDLEGTYSVGFYVPETSDTKWHEFDANVRRPGIKVRHRQGYLPAGPLTQSQDLPGARWQSIAQNPIGSSAIRIDARPQITAGDLIVVLQVAADDLYFLRQSEEMSAELDIALAERGPAGWTRIRTDPAKVTYQISQLRDIEASFIRLPRRWPLQLDTAAARVIVRDRVTGHYGIVDLPIGRLRGAQ